VPEQMGEGLLKYLPEMALILSASALALVSAVFALFLKPKIKEIDKLSKDFGEHKSHIETLKVADNLSTIQKLNTDVALLQQSENVRNDRINQVIEAQTKSIKELEEVIAQKIEAGDNHNLVKFLTWRVDQLETAYTLSKMQGGTKEEDARERWMRAKDELASRLTQQEETA